MAVRRSDAGVVGASFETVAESPAATEETLAFTGTSLTGPLAVGGVTAMAAGAALVRFRSRLERNHDSDTSNEPG